MVMDVKEVIFMDAISEPTVSCDYKNHKFSVTFDPNMEFITGPRAGLKIIHDKYDTIKESARGYLHDSLDKFIDILLQGEKENAKEDGDGFSKNGNEEGIEGG